MTDESHDELSGALARSVDSLREEVAVRPAWRAQLLSRIEGDRARSTGLRVRPSLAIAAGIALLVTGAAIGWAARPSTIAAVAGIPASAPAAANVRFVFASPRAARVSVVGDFNQWNPTAMPLHRLNDGTWIIDVPLVAGRYAYAFVVDGRIEVDPAAPRAGGDFGENSVVMVRGS
jgi:hypothetical protein